MVTSRPGLTKLGCLVWVLLIAAVSYFGLPVVETHVRYLRYRDRIRQELRFRSELPNERIKRNLQIAADSLGLPPEAGEVTITRRGGVITVEADYEEIIHLPGTQRSIRYRPKASDTY